MASPINKMSAAANLWIRQMYFENAGDKNEPHEHTFDHMTLLAHGSIKVTVDSVSTEFKAPHIIWVAKGKKHYIEALEAGTVAYCVHALKNKESADSEILSPEQIPNGVDPIGTGLAASLLQLQK